MTPLSAPIAPPRPALPRSSLTLRLQGAGVGVIVAMALGDYLRWQAVAAERISFGQVAPMAPATEWLFVVLGVALGLQLLFPTKRSARLITAALSVIATAVALHVLACHLNDRVPEWEHWLDPSDLRVEVHSFGQISTQSAVLFLLSNFSLCALLCSHAGRPVFRDAGILASLLVELFALASVVSYAAGNPPMTNVGWLKLAPLGMFEFTLFNFVLLSASATNRLRHWFFGTDPSTSDLMPISREEKRILGVLAGVGLIALTAGIVYLRFETKNYRTRSIDALQSMSKLKVYQIEQWRRERFGDARTLMRAPFFAEAVRSLASESTANATRAALTEWLRVFVQEYGYARVVVLNRAMEPVLTVPGSPDLSADGLRETLLALRPDSDVMELPPYLDGAGVLHWDLLVPVRPFQSATLDGAILLQTDPTSSVIKILQSWRAEFQTGQSMLWYREGNRLISLGGYRPVPGTTSDDLRPFGMIRSISGPPGSESMLTRMAQGELSMGEGLDHRGVMIIGFGCPVADSSWLLSSRVDSAEVYAPLRRSAVGVAGVVAGLLGTTGLATSWLWRQRQKSLLHDRLTAELEQKRLAARLGFIMRDANDIIFVTDEMQRFIEANQQAVDSYGWTKEELLQMTIPEICAPDAIPDLPESLAKSYSMERRLFETIHRRKDGTTFPVEISTRRVEIDGRPHLFSIIRNITERRTHQVRIEQLGRLYRVLSQVNEVIFRASEKADLLRLVCQTVVESGQYKFAWIRWHDSQTQTLERVAQYGQAHEPMANIRTDQPETSGPSGHAFLENRTYVCNDIFDDPLAEPWRRAFEATGSRSCIAIPIRRAGAAVAVLTVYASDRNCFGKEETALLEKATANLEFALDALAQKERRRASDEALRASDERYRLIAENTSDVIWLYDLAANRFSYVSPSVLALRGFPPDEVLGQTLETSLTPESAETVRGGLQKWLTAHAAGDRSRRNVVVEVEQKRKDGSIVPTEVVASLLFDAVGRPTHLLGITRDITERRRARETLEKFNTELEAQVALRTAELAARNREIEALIESIPDTVLLCDASGAVISSHSPPMSAGSTNSPIVNGLDPAVLDIARKMHGLARATNHTVIQEFERMFNGSTITIEARATLAGAERVLILLRDVSARKRIERDVLANLDRERQLSEMKSQFVSVASHEFRTPLAAATGSLELLERHAARMTEGKRVELLTRAQRSLGRLTTIMDNVLQLSRADSGRVKVKRIPVDLVQIVQDLIHEVEAGDRERHVFAFQHSGQGNAVPVDTNLFNHILSNLLGNAVRYSPTGTRISVTLEIAGPEFALTVADEGIGIPVAERERVFEPFARGSNVGQISGTGLGLNIVKRYAELLGGSIELLPTDRGAAFRVNLPVA